MVPSPKARVAAVLIFLTPAAAAAAAETVTEPDAVRLFLEQSPQARLVPLIEQSVAAELRRDAPVSNPAVAYQVEDAAGVRDEFLTFQQELPITGRRKLVRAAADAGALAAGLVARQELRASAAAVRLSFYEVMYRENVFDRLRQGAGRLERIVDVLAKRESEGEGSGYDRLRAEQEQAALGIETAEAESALSAARSRFGSFFDPAWRMESARLEGTLELTEGLPETEEAVRLALAQREDLMALRTEAQRLDLERQAARRTRVPEPTLSAGWKRVEIGDFGDTGFIAALAVPLPIFDRGEVGTARATADLERAKLEAEILERQVRADVKAALARERTAREAARRHGESVVQRAADLRKIAELAYDEGEAGILELLDAYRTALSSELRALGVRYEAKRAAIERQRAIGIEVTP